MPKILIVEDDERLAEELKSVLADGGYDAEILEDFDDTTARIVDVGADLVLLDVNIPGLNGERVLRRVREKSRVPVIMLTSRDSEVDEVMSMSSGADDYVRKPYSAQVLLLRIEAVLGRAGAKEVSNVLWHGGAEVDLSRSVVRNGTKEVILSKNELAIVSFLIKNRGKIMSRAEIMDYLWDDDRFVDDNTLTVNINRLRQKLDEIGLADMVQTRRAQGYIIE